MKLNRKGQTLVEYVLIISLITMTAIGAVKLFGGRLQDSITEIGCTISGQEIKYEYNDKGKKIHGSGYCAGDENKLFE